MKSVSFIYYEEDGYWIGWLADYPDYRTQGKSVRELRVNLRDIYDQISRDELLPAPMQVILLKNQDAEPWEQVSQIKPCCGLRRGLYEHS